MKTFEFESSKKIINSFALGFAIAFLLVFGLIVTVNNPNPVWGKNWFVKPLILTPTVAAFGGFAFYYLSSISFRNQWISIAKTIVSILAYIFFLWIGTVIGFNGTLWN